MWLLIYARTSTLNCRVSKAWMRNYIPLPNVDIITYKRLHPDAGLTKFLLVKEDPVCREAFGWLLHFLWIFLQQFVHSSQWLSGIDHPHFHKTPYNWHKKHYSDVIMSTMTSKISSLTIVHSTVYSGADHRKHQNSASLASVRWAVSGEFPTQRASNAKNVSIWWRHRELCVVWLNIWDRDKMDAIFQTTFSNAFSWMKIYEFRLSFHWSLFLWVQLTILQHWFR